MGNIKILSGLFLLLMSCGKKNNLPTTHSKFVQTSFVKGGKFTAFEDSLFSVTIPDLEVMRYEVNNQSFGEFVKQSGYITTAEKKGEGMVFDRNTKQWKLTKNAWWKHPQGPGSDIEGDGMLPVVQISQEDACAYCEWLHMRLPTEVEWSYIYQQDQKDPPQEKNIWQGIFPYEDKGEDGFKGSSPVGYFGAGGSGCYDIQGNVWERCADFYHEHWPQIGKGMNDSLRYFGPVRSFSESAIYDTLTVIKGGSFLCADNYCRGYANSIRMGADANMGYEHVGFRCVKTKSE